MRAESTARTRAPPRCRVRRRGRVRSFLSAYQEALWVAESDPSLAWLLLVSSVEGAANQWKKSRGAPEDRLRAAKPELAQYCDSLGVDGLLSRVASEFADSLGATKKFVDFLIAHLPSPPDRRPPEGV